MSCGWRRSMWLPSWEMTTWPSRSAAASSRPSGPRAPLSISFAPPLEAAKETQVSFESAVPFV